MSIPEKESYAESGPELTVSISEKAWVPALSFNEMELRRIILALRVTCRNTLYVQGAASGEVDGPSERSALLSVELLDLRGERLRQ